MIRSFVAAALIVIATPAHAKVHRVVNVVDADTLDIPGSGPVAVWRVRAIGYDAPELHSSCAVERAHAQRARARVVALTAAGVRLRSELEQDSPYGRWLAELWTPNGEEVRVILVRENLARNYDGKTARQPWCDAEGKLVP